jgi:hypothetical protein
MGLQVGDFAQNTSVILSAAKDLDSSVAALPQNDNFLYFFKGLAAFADQRKSQAYIDIPLIYS